VDNLFFSFDAQVDYMAMYGREVGRATGLAGLFLLLELPPSLQPAQELLIGSSNTESTCGARSRRASRVASTKARERP
jgi:hypothetical protein